jgi:uncharacterized protein YggE
MTPTAKAAALAGLLLTAAALAAPPAALAQPALGDAGFQATTLNLSAEGVVQIAPDQATVQVGVQTRGATAAEAMAANAAQMNAVMSALRKTGIAERDIRTTDVSLQPQYSFPNERAPVLEGFTAGNDVTVTLKDVGGMGAVIDAVTSAGANQIQGISFGLKDPEAAQNTARQAAVKALTARADLYAAAGGYHVKRLINLTEEASGLPGPPMPMPMMAMAKAAAPTPVSGGELSVRVQVSGAFELTR